MQTEQLWPIHKGAARSSAARQKWLMSIYSCRDFNKGRHPAICRRFKRVKSPVRLLETKIFVH